LEPNNRHVVADRIGIFGLSQLNPNMDNYQRDYKFVSYTTSLCPECLKKLDAKISESGGKIYVSRICPEHGSFRELLEENAEFYLRHGEYDKPGTISKTQTEIKNGCPFDCGLCPNHDQHTCNGLIEITNACDLGCPTCYAHSGKGENLPIGTIDKMLDFFVDSEHGQAEILQISGGEPTLHPQILDIIELARKKSIKYILLNTNGLRLAKDPEFAKQLGKFKGGFEVYLQFDGLSKKSAMEIRGRDVIEERKKAVANLSEAGVPITLVATTTTRSVRFLITRSARNGSGASITSRWRFSAVCRRVPIQKTGSR
jgi:7,8-dihydro-6-hydroxymethylpterin dimethyltransferase